MKEKSVIDESMFELRKQVRATIRRGDPAERLAAYQARVAELPEKAEELREIFERIPSRRKEDEEIFLFVPFDLQHEYLVAQQAADIYEIFNDAETAS